MKRSVSVATLVLVVLIGSTAALFADVKTEEKSLVKLSGPLGRVAGFFAGKAMRDGIVNTVALKGNRKASMNENTGEIVDLAEQKVYTLDLKKKTYEVMTFEEMRKRIEEAMEKAKGAAREEKRDEKSSEPSEPSKQMEVEFSLKESGQTRSINGFDCREVIMTITAHEKGKTLEQAGGTVMTSRLWQTPRIAAMKELDEFNIRYAKALMGPANLDAAAQMATALAMYPAMKDMMAKAQTEGVKLDGTTILNETTFDAVQTAEQMSREKEQKSDSEGASAPRGLGGLGGMLGRKIMRRKEDDSAKDAAGKDAGARGRATIMTMTTEFLKVSTDVSASDVAIPAGFKEKK